MPKAAKGGWRMPAHLRAREGRLARLHRHFPKGEV